MQSIQQALRCDSQSRDKIQQRKEKEKLRP